MVVHTSVTNEKRLHAATKDSKLHMSAPDHEASEDAPDVALTETEIQRQVYIYPYACVCWL